MNKKNLIIIYKKEELEMNLIKKKNPANINMLFNGRNDSIKFVDDYASMILEAKGKVAEEKSEPKPEPSKEKTERKKSLLEFINEIIKDEKNMNEQVIKEYFFIILHYIWLKNYTIAIKI